MICVIVILLFLLAFAVCCSVYLYRELLDERRWNWENAEWMDPVNLVNGDENDEVD